MLWGHQLAGATFADGYSRKHLPYFLQARACVATLRVPAEKHSIKALRLVHFSSVNSTLIFLWRAGGGGCMLWRAGGVKPQECSGRFSGGSRRFPAAVRPLWGKRWSESCDPTSPGCVCVTARLGVKQDLMHVAWLVLAATKNTFL